MKTPILHLRHITSTIAIVNSSNFSNGTPVLYAQKTPILHLRRITSTITIVNSSNFSNGTPVLHAQKDTEILHFAPTSYRATLYSRQYV